MARSDRVLTFAKGMLIHGDSVRAARDAGYQGSDDKLRKQVAGLLKHPDVTEILSAVSRKEVLTEAAKSAALASVTHELESRAGRVRWLIRLIEGEITESVRCTGPDGMSEFIELKPNATVRLAALKILGQMHGDFVERLHLASDTSHTIFVVPTNNRGPLPGNVVQVDTLPANLASAVQVNTAAVAAESKGRAAPVPEPELPQPLAESYHHG